MKRKIPNHESGFLMPLLAIGLVAASIIFIYNSKYKAEIVQHNKAMVAAHSINDLVTLVHDYERQEYAEKSKNNNLDTVSGHKYYIANSPYKDKRTFPSSIDDLGALGLFSHCKANPTTVEKASNCLQLKRNPLSVNGNYGNAKFLFVGAPETPHKISLAFPIDNQNGLLKGLRKQLYNYNIGGIIYNEDLAIPARAKYLDKNVKFISEVLGKVPRSHLYHVTENGTKKLYFIVPIEQEGGNKGIDGGGNGLIKTDGSSKLLGDWDAGKNFYLQIVNKKLELSDGTLVSSENVPLDIGFSRVSHNDNYSYVNSGDLKFKQDISGTLNTSYDVELGRYRGAFDEMCQKVDSSTTQITKKDVNISTILLSVYPLAWYGNSNPGDHGGTEYSQGYIDFNPRFSQYQNIFTDISRINVESNVVDQRLHFSLSITGHGLDNRLGRFGDTTYYPQTMSGVRLSTSNRNEFKTNITDENIGGWVGFIVTCKKAKVAPDEK